MWYIAVVEIDIDKFFMQFPHNFLPSVRRKSKWKVRCVLAIPRMVHTHFFFAFLPVLENWANIGVFVVFVILLGNDFDLKQSRTLDQIFLWDQTFFSVNANGKWQSFVIFWIFGQQIPRFFWIVSPKIPKSMFLGLFWKKCWWWPHQCCIMKDAIPTRWNFSKSPHANYSRLQFFHNFPIVSNINPPPPQIECIIWPGNTNVAQFTLSRASVCPPSKRNAPPPQPWPGYAAASKWPRRCLGSRKIPCNKIRQNQAIFLRDPSWRGIWSHKHAFSCWHLKKGFLEIVHQSNIDSGRQMPKPAAIGYCLHAKLPHFPAR